MSKFGRVDICVNNAGIMDERVWEKMIEVNTVSGLKSEERRDEWRGPSQARPVVFSAEGTELEFCARITYCGTVRTSRLITVYL